MLKLNDFWSTPDDLFLAWDKEFHFTVDGCANEDNHKLAYYWNERQDALSFSWKGERVFINPPYSQVSLWLAKCAYEWQHNRTFIAALVNVATDTTYWHNYVVPFAQTRFIRGRIKFKPPRGYWEGFEDRPRYASALVLYGAPRDSGNG